MGVVSSVFFTPVTQCCSHTAGMLQRPGVHLCIHVAEQEVKLLFLTAPRLYDQNDDGFIQKNLIFQPNTAIFDKIQTVT